MPAQDVQHASPFAEYVRYHRGARERLYGVVDGARDLELARTARDRFGQTLRNLLDPPGARRMADVAPYLTPIDLDSGYLDLWADRLGTSAGILLLTGAGPDELRSHLRRIFVVTDEENEEYFFRFYDPRVLRPYLPTCTGEEAREFFGPIRRILVESDKPGVMLTCAVGPAGADIAEKPFRSGNGSASRTGAVR